MSDKVGIIIQGPIRDHELLNKNVLNLSSYVDIDDIVVSTWDDADIKLINRYEYSKANIVISDEQRVRGICKHFNDLNANNKTLQIYSTCAGIAKLLLKNNEYDYFIKIRTDEYCKNYEALLNSMYSDSRIHSGSIFFRGDVPYHIGDHVIAGKADDIRLMFESAWNYILSLTNYERHVHELQHDNFNKAIYGKETNLHFVNIHNVPAEILLSLNYIWGRGDDVRLENNKDIVNKYFKVFDVKHFDDFIFKTNLFRIEITNEDWSDIDYFLKTLSAKSCQSCMPHHRCANREGLLYFINLVREVIDNNDGLQDLKDPIAIRNSLYSPYLSLKEFKYKINIF